MNEKSCLVSTDTHAANPNKCTEFYKAKSSFHRGDLYFFENLML
jgi:hypothetical protein